MELREIIKKFKMERVKRGGKYYIGLGKANPEQLEQLKAMKPELLAELEIMEKEEREARKAQKAKLDATREAEEKEYLKKTKLHRCLIAAQDEYYRVRYYIRSLELLEDRACTPKYGAQHVGLKHVTPTMEEIMKAEGSRYYGIGAAAWEITPEQETQIMAEEASLVEQARVEQKKKRTEEAEKRAVEREKIAEQEREITRTINTTKPHQGAKDSCSYCGMPNARWKRETAAGTKYACEEEPGMIYAAAPSAEQAEGCLALLMQEHEAWAKRAGMGRCWECGMYSKTLDETGYCGC